MIVKRLHRCKTRAAFDKWRQHLFCDAVETTDELIRQTDLKIDRFDEKVAKIRGYHTTV